MILYFLSLFILIAASSCLAEETPDSTPTELSPVIISADRSQQPSDHVADDVEVYTSEDLADLPVHNLAEALSYMPGIDIQTSGPFGQPTAVSIRGAASRQVLVMVDGVPFNTQLSGQANLSIIPIEDIQQIEVIKGADSSAWGSSLGGVINVITKPVGNTLMPHGDLTTSFGQFDMTKNTLDLEGKAGNFGYSTFGSFMNAHGNLADSRTYEPKSFSKFRYDFNQTTSVVTSFGYTDDRLRYGPTILDYIYQQQHIARYGDIQLNINKDENKFTIDYKLNDQKILANTLDSSDWQEDPYVPSVLSDDFYQGISLKDVYQISSNKTLTVGEDTNWDTVKSNYYFIHSESVNTEAPYTNLLWSLEDWDLIPALRYDRNSQFGSQLSPSFGTVYHVPGWEDGLVRFKASRVFNAPPVTWAYNDFYYLNYYHDLPNPDLKPERALMYELGTEGRLFVPGFTGKLNVYRSDVKDALEYNVDTLDGTIQYQNVSKAVRQGGEVELDYDLTQEWRIFSGASFNDVRDEATKQIIRDEGIARESFKWGVSRSWAFGLKASLEGYYNRWSSQPGDANDRKPIFDLKLTQDLKNIYKKVDAQIFFDLYNLTNSNYWADPSFPLPGRHVEGGVSVSF